MSTSIRFPLLLSLAALAAAPARADQFTAGNLFVASHSNDRVIEFTPAGAKVAEYAAGGQLAGPWGLDFGPDGRLYVANRDSGKVILIDPDGALADQWDVGATSNPQCLAFGPDGAVFLSLSAYGAVGRIAADGTPFQTYTGGLTASTGVAISPNCRLIAASWTGDVLREFELDGTPLLVSGALADGPEFVAFSSFGWAYTTSKLDSTVRVFSDALGDLGPAAGPAQGLSAPMGIAFGPGPRWYVASSGNNRVIGIELGIETTIGDPALVGPIGIAIAPWRFEVELAGSLFAMEQPGVWGTQAIHEKAVVAVGGGGSAVHLLLKPTSSLSAPFASDRFVFSGLTRTGTSENLRRFHGEQRGEYVSLATAAALDLVEKLAHGDKPTARYKSVSGTLALSSSTAQFRGTVKSKKLLK